MLSRHNLFFFCAVLLGSHRVRGSSSTWAVCSSVVWNANGFAEMPEVPFVPGLIENMWQIVSFVTFSGQQGIGGGFSF